MSYRFVRASSVLLPLVWAVSVTSCTVRGFTSKVNVATDSSGESGTVLHDTRGSCVLPADADFVEQSRNPSQAVTVELAARAVADQIVKVTLFSSFRGKALEEWVVRAVTPLNMNCDTYRTAGLSKYGANKFVEFASSPPPM